MIFNEHKNLEGQHAFLSASQYHWLNYTNDKLKSVYLKHLAVQRGTDLHELAKNMITLGVKPEDDGSTFSMYVRDAIDYKMTPEQVLYFSENCFGTTDAIAFRRRKLRIHDLKTGATPAHFEQLKIYAALFCLEYKIKPAQISFELRIYQLNDILFLNPTPEEIEKVMERIVESDKVLNKINAEMEK